MENRNVLIQHMFYSMIRDIRKIMGKNMTIYNAAKIGSLEAVHQLIQSGVNIEERDNESNKTPLMVASENGHAEIVRILLDKGANIETKDNDNINDKAIDETLDVHIVEDGDIRMAVVFR